MEAPHLRGQTMFLHHLDGEMRTLEGVKGSKLLVMRRRPTQRTSDRVLPGARVLHCFTTAQPRSDCANAPTAQVDAV